MNVRAAVIGGGPAGLMAAEALLAGGVAAHVFDAMPSAGRKFLMAGKSGLNLTHAEPFETFVERFGAARARLEPALAAFPPSAVRDWARGLGVETFVGSSGRVFPADFKAAPLLRAWLRRLRAGGVVFHSRHAWRGWGDGGALRFATPEGERLVQAEATILALGGGSWPKLGSDGSWVALLQGRGVPVTPLRPANCGFDFPWSEHFRERFEGQPIKTVALSFAGMRVTGDIMVSRHGIEGGPVYTLSAALRDAIEAKGAATPVLDLCPGRDMQSLTAALARPRGKNSLATHLKRVAGLSGAKAGLLREILPAETLADPHRLGAAIKALGLRLTAPRPLAEAISSAGGIALDAIDEGFMLRALPGVFVAGEMLDWEAPTGGYLLTACLATGHAAGTSAAARLTGH